MCYVHNQWYDISCATLYLQTFSNYLTALYLKKNFLHIFSFFTIYVLFFIFISFIKFTAANSLLYFMNVPGSLTAEAKITC